MIKLIASDIDGTLVKDGTLAIDREYMEVIGRLIDKGIVFSHFCTAVRSMPQKQSPYQSAFR